MGLACSGTTGEHYVALIGNESAKEQVAYEGFIDGCGVKLEIINGTTSTCAARAPA